MPELPEVEGLSLDLRTRLADENIGIAEAQVMDAMRQQIFALRQAFIGALGARANLEVAFNNRSSLDRTEALLRRLEVVGVLETGRADAVLGA